MEVSEVRKLVINGQYDQAMDLIQSQSKDETTIQYYELKLIEIHIFETISEQQKALDLVEELLPELPKDINLRFQYLFTKANISSSLGKNEESESILDQMSSMIENPDIDLINVSIYYTIRGNVAMKQGKIRLALDYQNRGLEYSLSHDLIDRQPIFWNNIGIIYLYQGILDKAIECFEDSLQYYLKKSGDKKNEAIFIMNIGRTYYYMGEMDRANEYLADAENKALKLDMIEVVAESIFYQVLIFGDTTEQFSEKLYQKFQKLPKRTSARINLFRDYIQGYRAQFGSRARDLVEAQNIFRDLIRARLIDHQIHFLALLNYAELLFDEMDRFSPTMDIISDLESVLNHLLEVSREDRIFTILTQTLILAAKVNILENNPEMAIAQFEESIRIAKDQGMTYIAKKASELYDQSLPLLTILQTSNDWTIYDIFERMNPKRTLKRIKSFEKITEDLKEYPVLFFIINPGMSLLYSYKIDEALSFDENLIGNFLTAISAFGTEIFDSQDEINRIQIGDRTIIFQSHREFLFTYTFIGPSYGAIEKLNILITEIMDDDLFSHFFKTIHSIDNIKELDQLINRIFVGKT